MTCRQIREATHGLEAGVNESTSASTIWITGELQLQRAEHATQLQLVIKRFRDREGPLV